MNTARPIDLPTWPRRAHFEHYRHRVPCTYSITVELDVTAMTKALRGSRWKTYPTQIWSLASIVNRHQAFRLMINERDEPAVWDMVHPAFTVFNPDRETFANVWVPFDESFASFHDHAVDVLATHRRATDFQPQDDMPANVFDISSLPWTSFTGFNLNLAAGDHLLPIFTLGRYAESDGRTLLPVALQVHHAAADGFHTGRFIQDLQDLVDGSPDWLV